MNYQCAMKQNDWLPQPSKTLADWLINARHLLEPVTNQPGIEAQMVGAFVLQKSRSWIISHPEIKLSASEESRMDSCLQQLIEGYPFAYLSGEREFYGRNFDLRPGLLVPRPETELLIEQAFDWLNNHPDRRLAVDVGCGTGCIAVTLAAEIHDLQIDAIDVDPLAIDMTIRNAKKHHVVHQIHVLSGDLLSNSPGRYDLICANLPYIPSDTLSDLPAARFEPLLALDGGIDGLRLIEKLLQQSQSYLRPGGLILLEIEASQGESAPSLVRKYFPTAQVTMHKDLADLPRLVSVQI